MGAPGQRAMKLNPEARGLVRHAIFFARPGFPAGVSFHGKPVDPSSRTAYLAPTSW